MCASRRTAPLSQSQRMRKREVDRQSQQRLRDRRNGALLEAEYQVCDLQAQVENLQAELILERRRLRDLESENRLLQAQITEWRSAGCPAESGETVDPLKELGTRMAANRSLPPISSVVSFSSGAPASCARSLSPFPFYDTVPKNVPADCLADRMVRGYLDRREFESEIADMPDLSPFIYPDDAETTQAKHGRSLSKMLIEVLSTFPAISALPEQIANFFVIYQLIHWRVVCENRDKGDAKRLYERLPTWIRPLPIQFRLEHPWWMDHMPWPGVRKHLIENQAMYPFETFSSFYTPSFSVNWPYSWDTVLLRSTAVDSCQSPGGGKATSEVTMNPVFEAHIQNLSNWSVDETFRKKYPVLAAIVEESRSNPLASNGHDR